MQQPDIDDVKKLGSVMWHLLESIFLPLVLEWDGTGYIYRSVDASSAVHKDMKSHTGGVITLGKEALITMSTKQKLHTTSSTKAERVRVSDSMTFNMWSAYFFKAQGQELRKGNVVIGKRNVLYQDSAQSCIKLPKNGKVSSNKHTWHVHIHYFFVTDCVKNKEIEMR